MNPEESSYFGHKGGGWASLTGYGGELLEWSDFNDEIPEDSHWTRSDIPPEPGEHRAVRFTIPLSAFPTEPFWTIFSPALAHLNGWEEYPEEIDRSSIVLIENVRCSKFEDSGTWNKIRILDAITLPNLTERFPPTTRGLLGEHPASFGTLNHWFLGRWLFVDGNLESDVGVWYLCRKTDQEVSLVLYGEWFPGQVERIYVGNRRLSADEIVRLLSSSWNEHQATVHTHGRRWFM